VVHSLEGKVLLCEGHRCHRGSESQQFEVALSGLQKYERGPITSNFERGALELMFELIKRPAQGNWEKLAKLPKAVAVQQAVQDRNLILRSDHH